MWSARTSIFSSVISPEPARRYLRVSAVSDGEEEEEEEEEEGVKGGDTRGFAPDLLILSSSTASTGQATQRVDIILRTVTNVLELITGGVTTNCTAQTHTFS